MAEETLERSRQKRNRASLACDKCRERKVRCDSARPRCNQCCRSGFSCTYKVNQGTVKHPPTRKRTERSDIYARVQRLEHLVDDIMQNSSMGSTAVSDSLERNSNQLGESDRPLFGDPSMNDQVKDMRALEFQLTVEGRDHRPPLYSYSILGMLATAQNLQLIGNRIGQPDMPQKLMSSIQRSHRAQEDRKMALFRQQPAEHSLLDAELKSFCQRHFHTLGSDYIYAIITPEESDYAFRNDSGMSAMIEPLVVLLVICHMRFVGNTHGISEELLERQTVVAFMHATRHWALNGLLPCSSGLFRSLVFYALVTLLFTPLSQDFRALAVAHSAGHQLGVDDIEYCQAHDQSVWKRDIIVWNILRELDSNISLSASQPPGVRVYENSKISPNLSLRSDSDLKIQVYQWRLCEVYEKCYKEVFSRKALKKSHRDIFENILRLDAELEAWRSGLPASMTTPSEDGFLYLDNTSTLPLPPIASFMLLTMNMSFFALKAQLHILPAFVRSFLKNVDDDVLLSKASKSPGIASEAARNIFRLALSTKKALKHLPLYQFCVITAHQVLSLYCMMFPGNDSFYRDLSLLLDGPQARGTTPILVDETFETVNEILSRFREDVLQQGHSSDGGYTTTTHPMRDSLLAEGQPPSNLAPWFDIEPTTFDQLPVDSCQAM